MSAQQKFHTPALRFALLCVVALGGGSVLAGCSSPSSVGVPQEGALRTGAYPNFGIMPKGETVQMTFAEKDQLAGTLSAAKAQQGPVAGGGSSRAEIEARKRLLQAETAATLKAIEAGQ